MPGATVSVSRLTDTPAVSSSVIVNVVPVTARLPAVAVSTTVSSSSSTASSTMLTSAVPSVAPEAIVNAPGSE